jgi:hypothetical protein
MVMWNINDGARSRCFHVGKPSRISKTKTRKYRESGGDADVTTTWHGGFHLDPELASRAARGRTPGAARARSGRGGAAISPPQPATNRSQNLIMLFS